MDNLTQHHDAYKQALQDKDANALRKEKAWLTTAAASALLEQDANAMRQVRACFADLSALADHFDTTGKPGDRWRTLADVLTLALESGNPLEQLRLVLPSKVTGLMMKHIKDQAGITPSELAARCGKQPNHIANEIKKLEQAGLIHRLKRGRSYELYLSVLGKEAMDNVAPMKLASQPQATPEFKHIDKQRIENLTKSGSAPALPFLETA